MGTGIFLLKNLPYGKYRYMVSVGDYAGNIRTIGNIFYVDEVEFTINTGSVRIGLISSGNLATSYPNDELILTVKTV